MILLTLQFQQVRPLRVNIRSLGLEHSVQALRLQRGARHGEVDECDTRTHVRWELNGWVPKKD